MKAKRQRGSATTIIVIIVVLALLGVLGYVFWGKLSDVVLIGSGKQAGQSAKKTNSNLLTASFDKSFGVNMYFKYPKSWTIKNSHDGTFPVTTSDVGSESFTVTAPDKKYSVTYNLIAGGGIGGACEDKDAATIVAAESEDVDGWKGVKLVREITKSHSGKYLTNVTLVSTLVMLNVKAGGSACSLGPGASAVPAMMRTLTLADASVHGATDMNVTDGTTDQGVASEKEARQLFSGKTFDEAKAILLSTTLK